MIYGFPLLSGKDPVILILGSMPSVKSLREQEYYAFKYNRFWKILHLGYQMPVDNYIQKKAIIFKHKLALWDIIGECEREGSLDASIKNSRVNNICTLCKEHPTLVKILCNGKKSYSLYQKNFMDLKIECICMPSTSNANQSIQETELMEIWIKELRGE